MVVTNICDSIDGPESPMRDDALSTNKWSFVILEVEKR